LRKPIGAQQGRDSEPAILTLSRRTYEIRVGYLWATLGVGVATAGFWAVRNWVDKGQASLLYLPVVIACAVRFGFGPAVLGALLSFLCWDFFFLPPRYTFIVRDPKDWLSLIVFLVAAIVTAQLAARAKQRSEEARAREVEVATLFAASEAISREVRTDRLLAALTKQLKSLCHASRCLIFYKAPGTTTLALMPVPNETSDESASTSIEQIARVSFEHDQVIGLGSGQHLWTKALRLANPPVPFEESKNLGVYVPLHTADTRIGVLYVGPREDGTPYGSADERLILTLANHAAVVLARDALAQEAAQAAALKEADLLKDSLLSLVSHELRSPLAAIKASVTGLLHPDANWKEPDREAALNGINAEADRLGAVVSNLLDLSRLEAGAWQPNKDWCDITDVAGSVLGKLPPDQAARVHLSVAPDTPLVRADYTQIAIVLNNLLENAAKYAPQGAIDLNLEPTYNGQDESPSGVLIRVRDYGQGILAGEEESLFERFYRSHTYVSRTVHGIGLGLALCRAIVQAHGGRIWAGNASTGEPRGAVFFVALPIDSPAKVLTDGQSNDIGDR
jgi:two-component system sensor histidine kinase KdpD